ncbi:hypothetical protein [Muricoccus pecuniae]|uniref:Integrase n=1 Tax=Muricoccus pecuniae TaxID=693023 RepID=A0A840Y931_9PROT|nr:hypothetical protein [Roseomonas pecuniae]MBB5696440.1 integrase [Roseomonas pecuniae]
MVRWVSIVGALGPGDFDRLQRRVTALLSRANALAFPNRRASVTLYTARHLAAAAAKCVFDQAGVAALLGHRSTATAGAHYGRRSRAQFAPPTARPDPALAARIAELNSGRGNTTRPITSQRPGDATPG